jgi:integrase/recombinase XerD
MEVRVVLDQTYRDVSAIALPRWGRVRAEAGPVSWLVVDDHDQPVRPVHRFFIDFVAGPNRTSSLRSYAFDLLRWWHWLLVVEVEWNMATSAEVRDFVLWMKQTTKVRVAPRTASARTPGTVNPLTGKQYLDDQYKPRTIRHSILVTWNLAAAEIMFARQDHELRRRVGRHSDTGQVAGVRQA